MKLGYVDTSCMVAIAFDEPNAPAVARALGRCDEVTASNLLEAELRAALVREGVEDDPPFLGSIAWIHPDRPLTHEIRLALAHGHVRGAELWHLATALYLSEDPREVSFLTLDRRQREVAASLGFATEI